MSKTSMNPLRVGPLRNLSFTWGDESRTLDTSPRDWDTGVIRISFGVTGPDDDLEYTPFLIVKMDLSVRKLKSTCLLNRFSWSQDITKWTGSLVDSHGRYPFRKVSPVQSLIISLLIFCFEVLKTPFVSSCVKFLCQIVYYYYLSVVPRVLSPYTFHVFPP